MKLNVPLPIPLALLLLVWLAPTTPAGAALGDPDAPHVFVRDDSSSDGSAGARGELAEALVARGEAATGRRLDRAFRAALVETFSVRPLDELRRLLESGGARAPVPAELGDARADLLYTPVAPCRALDTRSAGGIMAPGAPRDFLVAGDNLAAQGGNPSGCGVPLGPATSVVMNLTAVQPAGAGHLRAWAVANPTPAAPFASVLNYGSVAGLQALANAVVLPICDRVAFGGPCPSDLRIEAFGSSVHLVGDVLGYFRNVDLDAELPFGARSLGPVTATAGGNQLLTPLEMTIRPTRMITCAVTCSVTVTSSTANMTGEALIRGGVATGGGSVFGGTRMAVAPVAVPGSSSATQSVQIGIAGSGNVRFGCNVDSSGDFLGDQLTGTVAWVCR